jgi:Sec-independent protein translocase protein TatA
MFGISGAELMVVLLAALVILGPDRLPVVARKAGQVMGELRKVSAGFEAEMRSAMYEQPSQPAPRPVVDDQATLGPATTDGAHEADDRP